MDLESRGIVSYLLSKNKGADQLRDYRTGDLCLCLYAYAKRKFSHDVAQMRSCVC